MFWQDCGIDEAKDMLLFEIKKLDPHGYYDNIFTDNGFVDLIYEITNRKWDWKINNLQDHYSAEIIIDKTQFYSENKDKYFALACAYYDALYYHNNR